MKLQLSLRLVLRRFLLIFLPLLILASVIAMLFYYLEAKNAKEERFIFETSEVNYVKLQMQTIINDFKMIKSDLAILTSHHEMHKHHEGGEFHRKKALAEEFLLFCDKKGIYDQVRLLDEKGKEIVRVNYNSGNPYIVPEDQLQFKGDRYYFKDTFKLDEDEMFVSPFDLNIEGGRIEKPLKPILRFGTTVFDRYGQKRGVVVLNYLGENLINKLKLVSVSTPGHIMLLNCDGYWLHSAKPEDAWGFMYEGRKNVNFGNDFLNAWQLIAVGESGHFYNTNGLFTFMTVHPLLEGWQSTSGSGSAFEESVKDLQAKECTWKIVSHVAPDVLSARLGSFTTILFSIYGAVIASIGCGSWFLANSSVRRMIAEEEVKALNKSLEQRVVERTEELKVKNVELTKETTERKKAEEDLKLFNNLINQSNDAIFVLNTEAGRILNVNEEAYKSLGYEREELLNMKVADITSMPDRKYWDIFEKIKEIGTMVLEAEHKRKDGTIFPVEVNAKVVTLNEESYMIAVARDITERKRVEIHEKRIMFTTNFSRSCRDFVELQPVTELVTKGLAEQLNVQRASVWLLEDSNNLVCQKLYEHPKDSFSEGTVLFGERYPDYIKAILNDNPIDAHNARTDPRTKEFLNDYLIPLNIYSMLDTPVKLKGKVSGVLCLEQTKHIRHWQKDEIDFANTITAQLSNAIDRITERKQAEESVRESSTMLQIVMDNIPQFIFWKDRKSVYLGCNQNFARVAGYQTTEAIAGKTDYDLAWKKEEADFFRTCDERVMSSGKAEYHIIEPQLQADGKEAWLDTNKIPLCDSEGNVVGILGTYEDITERKKAEEQIKESLKEKEVLLNEVHHRVKNNLQIISSLLDMSSMQTRNQETIELFEELRNRVDAMALVHSQLYESERFDKIDMERHIQELSGNLLNIYSKEKTITLDIKSAHVYLPVTQAVPCALVLNELISNSLKHAYRDGQKGTICISMRQSNDGATLLKVKDNGVGIPEEIDIERTKSLGLKLARNIVNRQLNGKMKVIRNKGAEFIIEFKNPKEEA